MKHHISKFRCARFITLVGISFCWLAGCSETQMQQTGAADHPDNAAQNKQETELTPEPDDPDIYDMSVWENIESGIYSGFGSIDVAYSKSIPPEGNITESIALQGWQGERVSCKLLVWSAGSKENISIKAGGFSNDNFKIDKERTSISVIKYVLSDQFLNEQSRACGPRDKAKIPAHISPDLLSKANSFTTDTPGTRPVWISVDIPPETPAGIYKGCISRQSVSGTVNHIITLEVLNKSLPDPSDWSFHLDLWQNPYAVARYHGVKLWSQEHLDLLRPLLKKLANAGQKCITTTLIDKPWGDDKPCFDNFGSMIKWTRKKNGTWEYDYSVFDKYVNLAMACGIKKQINCYSMVPVGNKFSWFDKESAKTVTVEMTSGTTEYEKLWRGFLNDFKAHLTKKGWLGITTLALDEREEEEMKNMFSFLKETAPEFKITMAGFYYEAINSSIYDFSSNWRHTGKVSDVIESRKNSGLKTTYYVACGIPKPNNFTFSPPSESCYEGWFAAAKGFDGFLRWAYNSWPKIPVIDSRYTKWPSGDTYLIYPGPRSSVRFERLREGIQDYEKIRILREELAENTSTEAAGARERLNDFLNSIDTKTLDNLSAADVINEGKQLIYEIVKSVFNDQSVRSVNTTYTHFWDEIPVSPSTTACEKIKDEYWHGQYQRVNRQVARADKSEIVFFGDSITWHWSLGGSTGQDVWKEKYSCYNPINMGNSGDITPVMLYRVTRGNLDFAKGQQPKVAVLLCGTNNFVVTQSDEGKVQWDLGANCPPEDVAHGVRAIAQVFRRWLPRTRVIMIGILPVSDKTKWAKCQQVNAFNAALTFNKSEVVYLDLQDKFLQSDGSLNKQLFTDGTHLTAEGYRVWAQSLDSLVSPIMKAGHLDPVKIMLIGGAITEGVNSRGAYRRYLDGMLRREGNLIDFVGSRKKHNDNQTEPDSYQYDVDHEGHWGKNSDWFAKSMPGLLAGDVPDVAVIHMGTEDIVSGSVTAESLTDEIVENIGKVIKSLRLKNRTVKIVLAKIIPTQGKTDMVNLLNRKISRYIKAHSTAQSPVVVADQHTGFIASEDLADGGILPNATGAKKMARVFAGVINNMVSGTGRR